MDSTKAKRFKRKHGEDPPLALSDMVAAAGGPHEFGIDDLTHKETFGERESATEAIRKSGIHGSRSTASCCTLPRVRLFADNHSAYKRPQTSNPEDLISRASSKNPYQVGQNKGLSTASFSSLRNANKLTRHTMGSASASHIVCAISENLARETCVASIDVGSPVALMVTKQANGQTYAETLAYLELLQPDEVLLNEGRRNSQLAKKILQLYEMDLSLQLPLGGGGFAPISGMQGVAARSSRCGDGFRPRLQDASTVVKLISRSYFDQTKGAELLQRVVREETYDASCSEEYILLSSTYALLHYTQQCLGAAFSKHSVHLTINSGGNNRMTIDRSTVFQLELLANARTGKTRNSLIGTIDRTKTTVGGRLLRANLMSPPTRVDTINSRLDLVDSFLGDEELFYAVLEHLQALPDIDKMLANIALVPWRKVSKKDATGDFETVTDRVANKGISALVCVKSTLAALPLFANALEDRLRKLDEVGLRGDQHDIQDRFVAGGSLDSGRRSLLIGLGGTGPTMMNTQCHHLLRVIISTMRQANLMQVLELVTDIFTDSTSFSRNTNVMRHHACFALKAESNCMMEVCRKAFLANVDDIYKLADEYADTYSMHVTVKHTTARGYFLSIPVEYASDLPQVFIQPAKSGKGISCTTEEVHSLNLRAQENVQDLLLMTHEKIQAVLDVARSHYDAFAALSDAVALLDMCHSFADVVALSRLPWCRPAVCHPEKMSAKECEEMTLTIVNGRYAIETNLASHGSNNPGQFIPNDTFASRSKHFTVITGVNGSGKSTYLKQVAMIVLLAHCGSYVPAERATVPIVERVCTRIGTSDDQEHNISTFLLEMKEAAFICQNASPSSLILIDELGRATSNEDGVAIAWAVSECLLKKKAITFFVTHYPQVCALSNIYPSVQNQHLATNVSEEEGGAVLYTHRLCQGPCNLSSNYGVEMAESCGWPRDVLLEARHFRSVVENKLIQGGKSDVPLANSIAASSKKALDVLKGLAVSLNAFVCAEEDLTITRSRLDDVLKSADVNDEIFVDGVRNLLFRVCRNQETARSTFELPKQDGRAYRQRCATHRDIDTEGSCSASDVSSLLTTTSQEGTTESDCETTSDSSSASSPSKDSTE